MALAELSRIQGPSCLLGGRTRRLFWWAWPSQCLCPSSLRQEELGWLVPSLQPIPLPLATWVSEQVDLQSLPEARSIAKFSYGCWGHCVI